MRPESTRPTRPATVGAADAPREALGPELLRAFETYFAAEQANLDALREASAGRAEFVAFHAGMLESQRRSLADLAFRIATLLPEAPAAPRARPALAAIVRQNRASRARALARSVGQSVGQPRRLSGLVGGLAAAGAVLFALLGGDGGETSLTPGAAISVRQAVAATAEPVRTPSPSATRAAPTPQPGILERARIVAVYGHPYEPITGILGKFPPGEAALQAKRLAREFEEADGRPTVGALHLTVHVAQAQQTADGTYLERLGERSLQPWIDAAREHELLLVVDTQIGWSDALVEAKRLEAVLRLPFVHLALDPEFATQGYRQAPGQVIGTLDAAAINDVQRYLGDLVRREGLPRKMLMVHQFRDDMITNPTRILADPDIEVVIDMDGFGAPGVKLDAYGQFSLAPHVERPGIKLFFEWDEPILTPAELTRLATPPDVIVYQ